jgi:Ca-activated chloride channel family protein
LALAAASLLAIAMARPTAVVRVAQRQAAIMLVTDHSGSMQATDVSPTRLAAAQRAANSFIDQLPGKVAVGAVAFSAEPDAAVGATTDHDAARTVIDGQVAGGATAGGDALQVALDLLRRNAGHRSAAIVLLSDGATNTGRDPIAVAQEAARQKIPVYTVALGTPGAEVPNPDPFGPPLDAAPDPQTLRRIAEITHARAFTTGDADRLSSIYKSLGAQLGSRREKREVTAAFAIGALALLLGAGATSVRWSARFP